MFIEKRKDGKHYLVHSVRINGKVEKVRVYLGTKDIESKKKQAEQVIKNRIEALKHIKDPYSTVLSSEEINALQHLEAKGDIKITHLDEEQWEKFTREFIYNTNAIEGSTVNEKEVEDILKNNAEPKYRTQWEIQETHGVSDAIEYIRKTKTHISLDLIKELHKLCFKDSKSFAGKLREKGVEVVVVNKYGQVVHRGAPADKVVSLLNNLIKWYDKNKDNYPPIVLAAIVHNQFETIHPFADGNGRVGRLLLNNILLRNNKPPVNIELEQRQEYYEAIRAYQDKGNIRPMLELIIKQYKKWVTTL